MKPSRILILDFGAQYTQLIARRIREQNVYCEIHPYNMSLEAVRAFDPAGIVLSGGPASVLDPGSPQLDPALFELGRPLLGICYGLQLLAKQLGGLVEKAERREYGRALLKLEREDPLFAGPKGRAERVVWMSHGDRVLRLPPGFTVLATSEGSPFAAIRHVDRPIWGLQFHPEVSHTESGSEIYANFVHRICGCPPAWTMQAFAEEVVERIRRKVGTHALCAHSPAESTPPSPPPWCIAQSATSWSVFSSTTVSCGSASPRRFNRFSARASAFGLVAVDASERFLAALRGVIDPERKRRIIGHQFIEVFEEHARQLGDVKFLVQGTLYPDVIESVSVRGPSATIKTHHNVGGLPDAMQLSLIEPLRELFKDEVREVGRQARSSSGASSAATPSRVPGLAIRVIGEVTPERLAILRRADAILIEELRRSGEYDRIWQAFAVFLPLQSVGVMGDERTYENAVALRCVTSVDGMTADWARMPAEVLATISSRITNEVKGVNRVVYDVSSKPPATIEWE